MEEREGGFVVLHRRIESWPLYRSMRAAQRHVITVTILAANWKPGSFWYGTTEIHLERGQLAAAEETLAKRAGTTRKVVRGVLSKMEAEGFITRKKVHPSGQCPTVITITKYDEYQRIDDEEGHRQGQSGARGGPEEGPDRTRITSRTRKEDLPTAVADGPRDGPEDAPNGQSLLAVVDPPTPPRLKTLTASLVAAYAEVRGCPYAHGGAKDAQALKRLLPVADDAEIERRWRAGLAASGWASCSTFAQLGSKWNDLAASAAPRDIRVGSAPAQSHDVFRAGGGGVKPWA